MSDGPEVDAPQPDAREAAATAIDVPARRFGLRWLFYLTAWVGLFLAADRVTAGTDLNFALRAIAIIVAWTCFVILLETLTYPGPDQA